MATEKTDVRNEPEEAEPNTLKDQWGRERPWDGDRYPETSAAREGKITKPSGQGGSTPKSRPDHQDLFPKNADPGPESREYGERLARREQGEDVDLMAPLESAAAERESRKADRASKSSESTSDREARTARVAGKDSPK